MEAVRLGSGARAEGLGWLGEWSPAWRRVPARQRNIKLAGSPAVDAQIDLNGAGGLFLLRANLNVSVPGVDGEVAQELAEAAHGICPYSKAVHGNMRFRRPSYDQ